MWENKDLNCTKLFMKEFRNEGDVAELNVNFHFHSQHGQPKNKKKLKIKT